MERRQQPLTEEHGQPGWRRNASTCVRRNDDDKDDGAMNMFYAKKRSMILTLNSFVLFYGLKPFKEFVIFFKETRKGFLDVIL